MDCFIPLFSAVPLIVPFLAVSKKLKTSLAQMKLSLIPILDTYMKSVSSQIYKYEIYITRKNKLFNLIYEDYKMNKIKIPKIKNINSEEYCRLVSQIYPQLRRLEKTMKHYSLNDSLYFIKLTQKCFENEIVKELLPHQ